MSGPAIYRVPDEKIESAPDRFTVEFEGWLEAETRIFRTVSEGIEQRDIEEFRRATIARIETFQQPHRKGKSEPAVKAIADPEVVAKQQGLT